jgi:hypothetical protein
MNAGGKKSLFKEEKNTSLSVKSWVTVHSIFRKEKEAFQCPTTHNWTSLTDPET